MFVNFIIVTVCVHKHTEMPTALKLPVVSDIQRLYLLINSSYCIQRL